MFIKQEPGLTLAQKENGEQADQKHILVNSESDKKQPKESWADQNTDHVDSPTVQLLSGEETLAEHDQQP